MEVLRPVGISGHASSGRGHTVILLIQSGDHDYLMNETTFVSLHVYAVTEIEKILAFRLICT